MRISDWSSDVCSSDLRAFDFGMLPNAGIGLARLEMIIASHIGVHPKALLEYDKQDASTRAKIDARIAGYAGPVEFYVDRLAEGIATITASVAPKPVIVRLSDFKSNEYANLLGGAKYEPHEENPMIGFRGASRYVDPSFKDAFALECRAVKRVREEMGLDNLRSEEHTSELQSLMRISYAVFCLKNKNNKTTTTQQERE